MVDFDILVPTVISCSVFVTSIIIWKLFKARWPYVIINSFSIAIIPLFIFRKFKNTNCQYIIDIFSVIEAILFIVAIISMLSLNTYTGCIANPRRQCFVCCRMKRELDGPVIYDDSMFENPDILDV